MRKQYSTRYDVYYDKEKDVWLETKCSDKKCTYCAERPKKPSDVKE